jgi:hypothetical protein
MKRALALLVAAVTLAAATSSFGGVSDGNYDPARMHCSGAANNVESPDYTEEGCHNSTLTISDGAGHEYFGIGLQQTASGEEGVAPGFLPFGLFSNIHAGDFWYDFGDGCTRYTFDAAAPGAPVQGDCPWFDPMAPNYTGDPVPADPSTGLRIYMSFDDNLAGGEHDSSELINNGPSDGGAIRVELDPRTIAPWLEAFAAANPQYILTHPLPAGEFGMGFCADGLCMALQTSRRVGYQGGSEDPADNRDAANYDGKNWDPEECSGNDDGSEGNHCDDPNTPEEEDITYWHNQSGTVYVEPGVQIFEDPDPQGSPIGPYPIPALYVGTCGVIIGGGPNVQMPASPFTNPNTGQVVLETGC